MRLNIERQQRLEGPRYETAVKELTDRGFEVDTSDSQCIKFQLRGNTITYYPYSGWASGKGIVDGRGLRNLLTQL